MGSTSMDVRDFGYVADADPNSAGINAAALNSASKAASAEFGTGFDSGGGGGTRVEIPRGTAYVGDRVVVHDGVEFIGHGTYGTILKMPSGFNPSKHFIRWGTPGSNTAVCTLQTLGAAGGFAINGDLAVSGAASFIQKRCPAIYATGNNSGVNFTITGTDANGSPLVVTLAGPVGGSNPANCLVQPSSYFKTISSVVTNGPTVGAVSVGMETIASFGARLTNMQLWSDALNAQAGVAMVATDNAQHTGLRNVKIFGGSRTCVDLDKGIGGASWVGLDEVETFNAGNYTGVNNPQIRVNYAGLVVDFNRIVMGGPGTLAGGSSGRGILHTGGHLTLTGQFHPESMGTGLFMSMPNANIGSLTVDRAQGHSDTLTLFHLDSNVQLNTVHMKGVVSNGSPKTVQQDATGGAGVVTGNIILPRSF
jgi:hypothetical protein